MTSEATYNLKFELLDFNNLCFRVSLASKCHNLQNFGTSQKLKHHTDSIPRS